MFLIRNSVKNIARNKKKYALLIVVIALVSFFSFVSLVVLNSSEKYLEQQKEEYGSVVKVEQNFENLFGGNREGGGQPSGNIEFTDDVLADEYDSIAEKSEYVDSIIKQSMGNAKLDDDLKVIGETEEEEQFGFGDVEGMNIFDFDVQVYAYSDYNRLNLFGEDVELYEGEYPQADDEVVVSAQFAELNGLKIGDEIKLGIGDERLTYKIVGLTTKTSSTDEAMIPMQNEANNFYMTTEGFDRLNETVEKDGTVMRTTQYLYVLNSYKDVENFTNWLYDNTEATTETHTVTYANNELESIISPVANLTDTLRIYLMVTAIIGGLIILFIIQLNFKDRSYEIGVLRALNMSRGKLIYSFVVEIIGATLIAFVIAVVLAYALVQPIGNVIVNSTSSNNSTEDVLGMPGGGNFGGPGGPGTQDKTTQTQSAIDDIDVSINAEVIMIDLGVILIIVIISSIYGLSYVYRYNPNKILKERG